MAKAICEKCFYTADKTEFEEHSDYLQIVFASMQCVQMPNRVSFSPNNRIKSQKMHHIKYILSNKNNICYKAMKRKIVPLSCCVLFNENEIKTGLLSFINC